MNALDASCPFCENNAKARTLRGDCSGVECPRCGKCEMASFPLPSTAERAERLLLEALHGQKRLNASINLDDPRFIAATYSWDQSEMLALYYLLMDRGWMDSMTLDPTAEITIEGYMALTPTNTTPGRPWPGRSLASAQMFRLSSSASSADSMRATRSDSRSTRSRSSSRSSSGLISLLSGL